MSAADCMNNLVDDYIQNPAQLGFCPPAPTPPASADATFNCLCALPTFTSWYLRTLCVNCSVGQSPLSDLLVLCPSFSANITATYTNSCSPFEVNEAEVSPSSTGISSSSSNLSTTATPLSTSSSSSAGQNPNPTTTPSSSSSIASSSTTDSSVSTASQTTLTLSMTIPSPSSSNSSKLLTITAVAASSYPLAHSSIGSIQTNSSLSPSPTFASTNETNTSASSPTALPSLSLPPYSSDPRMSTGAKTGIGVGAAAAAVGIGFVFLSLFTILRRRNSRFKSPEFAREVGYAERGGGSGEGAGGTRSTLAEMYRDDEPQFYRGLGGSDGPRGHSSGSGLGMTGIASEPGEKMGFVPSERISEVTAGGGDEPGSSEFATPLHTEGVLEIYHIDERVSEYSEEDSVAPRGSDNVWHTTPTYVAFDLEEASQRYSTHRQDAALRYSTAQESVHSTMQEESNYEAAMRPKSRIYSVVDSPALDLGQAGLSDEELARLEDEERRIDEAIRESERRAEMKRQRVNPRTPL